MIKERSIIFSGEMVRAILDRRKTMTRRPVKPQPTKDNIAHIDEELKGKPGLFMTWLGNPDGGSDQDFNPEYFKCPYGQPGDRLWVRETWAAPVNYNHLPPNDISSWIGCWWKEDTERPLSEHELRWRPSIFMPRWASRITLQIVNVRVERLQEIGIEDIHKEGFERWRDYEGGQHISVVTATNDFWRYWNSLYTKKPEYQWEANPWVWVVEFNKEEG